MATEQHIEAAIKPISIPRIAEILKFWKKPKSRQVAFCGHANTVVYIDDMDEARCECGADLTG